jgi:hypothetical protein
MHDNFVIKRLDAPYTGYYVSYLELARQFIDDTNNTVLITNGKNKTFFTLSYARLCLKAQHKYFPQSYHKYIIEYVRSN